MIGAMLGLGYATANYFGLAFYYASDPTVSWRAPLGLQLFFPLMILCLLPFVPESPRYFLMMDKKDEAWSVIEKLHDDSTDSENEFARREFYQMAQQAAYDRTINSSWVELFRRSSYRKRVLFGMFLMILCQSTGELVLNQYVRPTSKPTAFQPRKDLTSIELGTKILRRTRLQHPPNPHPTDGAKLHRLFGQSSRCIHNRPLRAAQTPPHRPRRVHCMSLYRSRNGSAVRRRGYK